MDVLALDAFVMALLTGAADMMALLPGGVHSGVAPKGTAFPYIVFSPDAESDVNTTDGERELTRATYAVRAVLQGSSYAPLGRIAGMLDGVLQRASGQQAEIEAAGVPLAFILGVVRSGPLRRAYALDGVQYRELGGYYRCMMTLGT